MIEHDLISGVQVRVSSVWYHAAHPDTVHVHRVTPPSVEDWVPEPFVIGQGFVWLVGSQVFPT